MEEEYWPQGLPSQQKRIDEGITKEVAELLRLGLARIVARREGFVVNGVQLVELDIQVRPSTEVPWESD